MKISLSNGLLIATNNPGKFSEISSLLSQINIKAISPFNFNLEEPEESGKTFAQNALIKAKFYGITTSSLSIADDSGLCIEALSGKPGIHSARFAIDKKTGEKNFPLAFEKIFLELKKINQKFFESEKAKAYFICSLCLFDPKSNFSISFEGRVDGILRFPPLGSKGFGYDPIFVKNGMTKTFGEINPKEKDMISHRAEAFKKLTNWLEENQAIPKP